MFRQLAAVRSHQGAPLTTQFQNRIFLHYRCQFSSLMRVVIRSSCLIIIPRLQIYNDLCPAPVWQSNWFTAAAAAGVVGKWRQTGIRCRCRCQIFLRTETPPVLSTDLCALALPSVWPRYHNARLQLIDVQPFQVSCLANCVIVGRTGRAVTAGGSLLPPTTLSSFLVTKQTLQCEMDCRVLT